MSAGENIIVIVVFLLYICGVVAGYANTKVVSETCNGNHYENHGEYESNLPSVLADLWENMPGMGYNYYSSHGTCYWHAACNGVLSAFDCGSRLASAVGQVVQSCSLSIGARLQLTDCRMRNENSSSSEWLYCFTSTVYVSSLMFWQFDKQVCILKYFVAGIGK